jgi:hypothetical protein
MLQQKLWCGLNRWLACEWYLDLLSRQLVGIVRWGKTASLCRVIRAVVFSRWQLCFPLAAALFGQLLTQQGGAFQFWMLPSVPEISSGTHLLPCFGRLACRPTPCSQPLCFYWFLLSAGGSSGRLVCRLTPWLSLYASPDLCQHLLWAVVLLAHTALSLCAFCMCHREFSAESLAPCPAPENSAFFSIPVLWEDSAFHPHLQCQC